MESRNPTSAGIMALLGEAGNLTSKDLLEIIARLVKYIMLLEQKVSDLKQENSQPKQERNNGTTNNNSADSQPENKKAGRHKKEITLERFRDALKKLYRPKAELIISWIMKQNDLLKNNPSYCAALTGNRRFMAPLYITISARVYTPKNPNDARPVMEGSPLERFFALPNGSYNDYSLPNKYEQGEIQELTESFREEVLSRD